MAPRATVRWNEGKQRWMAWVRFPDGSRRKVERVEYLRTRLTNAGVPNLLGENALPYLAEWALATGLISRVDLALLPPR